MGRTRLILLDTHVAVWLAFDESKLSKTARSSILQERSTGGGLAISDITLLEIMALFQKKRLELNVSLELFLQQIETRFIVLPITSRACVRALELPSDYPKDPADRIIGGTALVEGLSLVTADREIRRAKALPTIW
jgi:PIN domain nuclease of toxin-antitoxin system